MGEIPATAISREQLLIAEGKELKARIDADSARLKEISAELLKRLPAGKHEGSNGATCSVIADGYTIKPTTEDAEAVREIVGDDLFWKLFERIVSFKPLKEFRTALGVLVNKRTATRVLNIVKKPTSGYIKWG